MFDYYYSIIYEVLVVILGKMFIWFGGEDGWEIEVWKGDVIIILVGVVYKNMWEEKVVVVIGVYLDGR